MGKGIIIQELTKSGMRELPIRRETSCSNDCGVVADYMETEGHKTVMKCNVCGEEWYKPFDY